PLRPPPPTLFPYTTLFRSDAARAGRLSGAVDDAARAVITSAGFGPDYKFFTHRLGHGIGLDGHEHPYLVRGSKTVLEPGMTFSKDRKSTRLNSSHGSISYA